MIYRFCSSVLTALLIFQLVALQPSFSLPETSAGAFSVRTEATKISYTPERVFAFLTDVQKTYDDVLFVGDIMLGRNVEYLIRDNNASYPFNGVDFSAISNNAAVFGNFEASIPIEHHPTPENMLDFSVDPSFLGALKKAGFTHMSLANNHTLDFGKIGFENTITELRLNGITPFGAPENVVPETITYIPTPERRVAILGFETLSGHTKTNDMVNAIKHASERSEFQIVSIHWGNEYSLTSSAQQRKLAQTLVEGGADLIIGHHPHVVQEIDLINGAPVFYSVGNYIFDQYFSSEVKTGLIISFSASDSTINLLPVSSIETLSQPHFMKRKNHAKFLVELADKSHPSLKQQIHKGQLKLQHSVASSSKIAMIETIK